MRKLSVLVIHNHYQQSGGEDAAVRAEVEMLRQAGHRVIEFTRNNRTIADYSALQKALLAVQTTWNSKVYAELRQLIQKERPDVAHCHNLVPLVSPAAYDACNSYGVPVVQTLHNYRLLCPAGTLFSNGHICEDCTRSLAHGVVRGCYRKSKVQTATLALMLGAHRLRGTWNRSVDAYVAVSQFSRNYFVAAGLSREKVHVKPNFLLRDPGRCTGAGKYALFVSRLTPEKGVLEMLRVWRSLPHIPLVVVGDGPISHDVAQTVLQSGSTHIKLLGQLGPAETQSQIKGARFLVFPSRWYEPFGMALLEAAASGIPAIAARIGGVPELVVDGLTGLLFDPENFEELAEKSAWAWTHPGEMAALGGAARDLYLQKYTADENYRQLMKIYGSVIPLSS